MFRVVDTDAELFSDGLAVDFSDSTNFWVN